MTQDWLRQRERSNIAGLRFLVWVSRRLGRTTGRVLLVPVCIYYLVFASQARAASRAYLARVLGRRPSIVHTLRHFLVFATVALDRIQFLSDDERAFELHVEGQDIVEAQVARDRGCFLLGAHLGSFEALRLLGRRRQLRVCLVMYERNARNVAAVTRAVNPELGDDIIELGAPDSMLKVADRLQRGHWVGMLGDRGLHDRGQVRVPFLGGTASFPTAPFRIAAMTGGPILLMVGLYRDGNRYDLCFERLIESPVIERTRREETIREWVALYASRLEHYCRREPYNWFNFFDFWAGDEARR